MEVLMRVFARSFVILALVAGTAFGGYAMFDDSFEQDAAMLVHGPYAEPNGGGFGPYHEPSGDNFGPYHEPNGDNFGPVHEPSGVQLAVGPFLEPGGTVGYRVLTYEPKGNFGPVHEPSGGNFGPVHEPSGGNFGPVHEPNGRN
jgi:hypothetical protein